MCAKSLYTKRRSTLTLDLNGYGSWSSTLKLISTLTLFYLKSKGLECLILCLLE